jgi:hypothetical protein
MTPAVVSLLGLLTGMSAEHRGAAAVTLPHMLSIDWQRLPDLAIGHSGFQNSDGGTARTGTILTLTLTLTTVDTRRVGVA